VKVLLDNCVDARLSRHLVGGHEYSHASGTGWAHLSNGVPLATASAAGFLAMITVDQRIRHQQRLETLPLTLIEINTRDIRLVALRQMTSAIERALGLVAFFRLVAVRHDGQLETLIPRSPAQ